jgi:hypothetical protein
LAADINASAYPGANTVTRINNHVAS